LMAHDLIDEYRIWIHPLVIGTGTRLFDDGVPIRGMELVETRQLSTVARNSDSVVGVARWRGAAGR
jgi:dihydrofolate reductase